MTEGQMHQRWHELVVKHALGAITQQEAVKLERYQALVFREARGKNRISARAEYQYRLMKKTIGRINHDSGEVPKQNPAHA